MSEFFSPSLRMALDGAISRLVHDLSSAPLAPDEERKRAIAKYRSARAQTIAIIEKLTPQQVNFSAGGKAWSIGQNVEHLLLTETLYKTYMRSLIDLARKTGRDGGERNVTLTFAELDNSLALIPRDVMPKLTLPLNALNAVMPRAIREAMFRFPLIPGVNPTASQPALTQDIAELRSRAASSLNSMEEIFSGNLPLNLMDMTLTHPVLGTNNVAQILGILAAHEERHHLQMRTILTNPRFPVRDGEERSSTI